MKKTVLGAAVLVLAACGGSEDKGATSPTTVTSASATPPVVASAAPPATTPPPKPPLADLMKKTAENMAAAWAAHDSKKLMMTYSDDVVMSSPGPMGWQDATKAQIEPQMTGLFAAFPDAKASPVRIMIKGNMVVSESVFTGTNTGDMVTPNGTQKATGKPVGYHVLSISWFNDDGLVNKQHFYMDHGTMLGQLGKADPKVKFRAVETAPAGPPAMVMGKDSPDEAKNVAAVTAWYSVFEKKDDKGFLAPFADDVMHVDYTQPADIKGKDGAKKEWAELFKTFPDAKIATTAVTGFDNIVVAECAFTGTMKGAMAGIKPTNKNGTTHMVDVFEMKDGKVKAATTYGSTAEGAFAFGVMPPATKPAGTTAPPPAKKP